MKRIAVCGLVTLLCLAIIIPSAYSQEMEDYTYKGSDRGEAILFDMIFLRPLAMGSCAVGAVAAFLATPFTHGKQERKEVYDVLIKEPGRYFAVRPLGEIYEP